jgi:LmbE family N-acetylglucosaminyl deacetylase
MLASRIARLLCICVSLSTAQVHDLAIDRGAPSTWQALLRLRNTVTVLHITAHPDDEDGPLLTWLTRHEGVRTGLLTLTRGEGGANLIGPEMYDALGILRTEELLTAGRFYGVDQFFTRATDFGFSKRLDETLEHWDRDKVLADAVRVVRMYKPDIVIARFQGDSRDGHGNHQAAGVIARDLFRAAADANLFPDQLQAGLRPWQIRKVYAETRERDGTLLTIDTGVYDPLLGASYSQTARQGLAYQRSQGSGARPGQPGPFLSALRLIESVSPKPAKEATLFDGLDTSLAGLAKLAPSFNLEAELTEIEGEVARAQKFYDARNPIQPARMHVLTGLKKLRAVLGRVREASLDTGANEELIFRLETKEEQFVDALNKLFGMWLEVLADPVAIPGQTIHLTARFLNRSTIPMDIRELKLRAPASWQVATAAPSKFEVKVPADAMPSRPYWSRRSIYRDHLYDANPLYLIGMPNSPPEVVAELTYQVDGVTLVLRQPVLLTVVPAISVALTPHNGVIPVDRAGSAIRMRAEVRSNVKGAAESTVKLEAPTGWKITPPQATWHFTFEGETQTVEFVLEAPRVASGQRYSVAAVATYQGREYREGYETIQHPDLQPRPLYRSATAELLGVDVKVKPGLRIGYIMGVGDEIPQALEQIGGKVQMLGPQDLASGDLSGFLTIIVGIRTSAVRDDYKAHNSRLLEYVKNGGNLVVQYQTPEFDAAPYGPYPYKMGRNPEEVSEENSTVTILDPANPVFQGPNQITQADFDGWIEERGSKFLTEWDSRYTPLLECHDREQPPQKGGLLVARYGKGTFLYAAYAFYRQLPAGVPGAYRLFANLISQENH